MRFATMALAVALLGCGSTQVGSVASGFRPSEDPSVRTDGAGPELLAGFVLLRPGAALFQSRGDLDPIVPSSEMTRSTNPGEASVFRLVSDQGDWIEIQNIPGLVRGMLSQSERRHCGHQSEISLGSAMLQFWVHREELHPVLQEPLTREFRDGSKVELIPGIALRPSPTSKQADLRLIQTDSLEFMLEIPTSKVGLSYLPVAGYSVVQEVFEVDNEAMDSGAMRLAKSIAVKRLEFERPQLLLLDERGAEALVQVTEYCSRLTVMVPTTELLESRLGPANFPEHDQIWRRREKVAEARKNATVYWRGGAIAGSLTKKMPMGPEVASDGQMRCFSHSVRETSDVDDQGDLVHHIDAALELCFARKSLTPFQ